MPPFQTLDHLDVRGKRVLVRLDLNLPLHEGAVMDMTRLARSLPTLKELAERGARLILLSHLGRPQGGDSALSLAPIAKALSAALAPIPLSFCPAIEGPPVLQAIEFLGEGAGILLENTRFRRGEEANDRRFAEEMATWGEVYVNDAFSASHRAHTSTEGIAHLLPSYAGRLMEAELQGLRGVLESPQRPLMAIVGGAKISSKLPLLENLAPRVDHLVVGGAMANTFLAAQGREVGASLYEPGLVETARSLLQRYPHILLPHDVVVRRAGGGLPQVTAVEGVRGDQEILDMGPLTCASLGHLMKICRTLLWNGPLGMYECPPFDAGSLELAREAARLTGEGQLVTVAGGGDTVAILARGRVLPDFTYVSTGGGAFLTWMEGKPLPGVLALGG